METQSRRQRVIHRSLVQFICAYYVQLHSMSHLFRGVELKTAKKNTHLRCTRHKKE